LVAGGEVAASFAGAGVASFAGAASLEADAATGVGAAAFTGVGAAAFTGVVGCGFCGGPDDLLGVVEVGVASFVGAVASFVGAFEVAVGEFGGIGREPTAFNGGAELVGLGAIADPGPLFGAGVVFFNETSPGTIFGIEGSKATAPGGNFLPPAVGPVGPAPPTAGVGPCGCLTGKC